MIENYFSQGLAPALIMMALDDSDHVPNQGYCQENFQRLTLPPDKEFRVNLLKLVAIRRPFPN